MCGEDVTMSGSATLWWRNIMKVDGVARIHLGFFKM
jgi:hypothetical protein